MLFDEYDSPCTHAIVACRHEVEDPYKLFAEHYTISTYRKTYAHFLRPFSIENLPSTPNILPPVFKKQRGRPLAKRIRKGSQKRKERKCSKCYGLGHNVQKCRFAPAINKRQQRAREWHLSIDSSGSSNSSSSNLDSSNLDSSDLDSEINKAVLEDQAESNLYYERVARAWEIVNRRQQELEESDGELSVLASSLFNSMEGIESGQGIGIKSGDIEMGGTGSSLTDQDGQDGWDDQDDQDISIGGQDDQDDNAGGQDDQDDSVGGQDNSVDSGAGVQCARTSPRRTRSGKLVKYMDE